MDKKVLSFFKSDLSTGEHGVCQWISVKCKASWYYAEYTCVLHYQMSRVRYVSCVVVMRCYNAIVNNCIKRTMCTSSDGRSLYVIYTNAHDTSL